MPENSHIQTYLKCNQFNFKEVIKHFSKVIDSLKLNPKYFIDELEWEVSENGFTYVGGSTEPQLFKNNGYQLHLQPYVLGWTPEVIKGLEESYVEVGILFRTEEIEINWGSGQLRNEFQSLIWRIMCKFSEEFKQTGVYFTSEVTDGVPWEALVSGNNKELWSFDAAILPVHLFDMYKNSPEKFFTIINKEVMYVAQKSVWKTEPWYNTD